MAIASWKGPLRKYKETSVSLKEEETLNTIKKYTEKYFEESLNKNEYVKAIQLTLSLNLGIGNYRFPILQMLPKILKGQDNSKYFEELLKEAKKIASEK